MISRRLTRRRAAARGFLVTWESELRAIAADTSAWSIETGGDLFGRWNDPPVVLLATRTGPNAQRDHAHFRLDVDYLRRLSEDLARDWQLRYFGDWHSHHRLGLSHPSGGDQKRILNLARRNQFPGMAEIIVTIDDGLGDPNVRIHPWRYELSAADHVGPYPMQLRLLPGLSPIREALLARGVMPEQEFVAWDRVPLNQIRIGDDKVPPPLASPREIDTEIRQQVLQHLTRALQSVTCSTVEHHQTGFGSIVVAKLEHPHYLAFALGADWPMPVLEVHRLNRDSGTTEVINAPADLIALEINGLVELFKREKARRVDS